MHDGVQHITLDSNDKSIFAMLDEIILSDKEKPLLNSTNMAAMIHTTYKYMLLNGFGDNTARYFTSFERARENARNK